MSKKDIQLLLIVFGILIGFASWQFVYKPNQQKAETIKTENTTLQNEVNEYFWEYHLNKLSKAVEVGINILPDLLEMCKFNDEDEMEEFIQLYTEWYNNHPQYPLCGYTPIELSMKR